MNELSIVKCFHSIALDSFIRADSTIGNMDGLTSDARQADYVDLAWALRLVERMA